MRIALAAWIVLAAAGCASSRHLAKVNDETITGKELRQEFARNHNAMEKILGEEAEVRRYLEKIVNRRLFIQEGYRMGLQDSPEIRDAVERLRAQKMVELFLREEVDQKVKPTDEEVKAVYAGLTYALDVRHVVVKTREEAEQVAAEVKGGADLEAIARERSIAPSAKRGGMVLVGWGTDEARERVAAGLKEGELSAPFESGAGWEVARLEQRKTVPQPPFEKVVAKLRIGIEKRKRQAREKELYASLWAKYGASVQECAPTIEALKAAEKEKDATPCASWQGGSLTAEALAGRVKLDQLEGMRDSYPQVKKALVEDLVNREVAQKEATARGYAQRAEVVDATRVLQDDLVESKLYREHVIAGIEVTDDDARRYYEAHLPAFVTDAQFEIAHLVVATPEQAKELHEKARSGQPFAELAESFSLDRSTADKGGLFGVVAKKKLTGELAPVAELAEDEVSGPIQLGSNHHLIKVLRVFPERQRTFEEAKGEARAKALQEAQDAAREKWVSALRAAGRVELNDRGIRAYKQERIEWLRRENEAAAAEVKRKTAAEEKLRADVAATAAAAKPAEGDAKAAHAGAASQPGAAPADAAATPAQPGLAPAAPGLPAPVTSSAPAEPAAKPAAAAAPLAGPAGAAAPR
jgi:parvulin-like peptidyl-prolyl isomerase